MDARIQWILFPHLCVGFLFLVLYPAVRSALRSSASVISHTTHTPPFTHTICHTQLWHISHNFSHRTFVSHNLSHTISHTLSLKHSFTHLLRTVIANSDVERILRAKNTPVKPDRRELMTRPEKDQKVIPVSSLLEATVPFEIVGRNSDCENRTGTEMTGNEKRAFWFDVVWKRNRQGGSWVNHIPSQKLDMNWNWSRYVDPASRIDITECHSRLRWLQNYDIPCSPLLET